MNERKQVYLIGHVSQDLIDGSNIPVMGGAVAYMARVFKIMGWDARIITKLPSNHQFLKELNDLGIIVHNLPISDDKKKVSMTTFEINNWGEERDIFLRDKQEDISVDEIRKFSANISRDALIVVAPVMDEVDINILPFLRSEGLYSVLCPQGVFRRTRENGLIYHQRYSDLAWILNYANMAIFSREDMDFYDRESQDKYIKELARIKPVFVTDGSNGSEFFYQDERITVRALSLKEGERRKFIGAGDVFAAALLHSMMRGKPLVLDMEFASAYTTQKIGINNGKEGISGLPTIEEFEDFVRNDQERIVDYAMLLLPYVLGREAHYEPSDFSFRRIET